MVQIDEAAEAIDPTSGGLASHAHSPASHSHAPRRSGTSRILTGLVALAAVGLTLSALADEPRFFRIGTAGTTGTYFQIGGILASAISSPPGSPNCQRGGNCGVPGLIAVAQATQGSVENVDLIGRAQLESALSQADIASWAFHGTGIYKTIDSGKHWTLVSATEVQSMVRLSVAVPEMLVTVSFSWSSDCPASIVEAVTEENRSTPLE